MEPPWQVRFMVAPPEVATEQVPLQVMVQVPEVQAMFEPAPAEWLHDLPAQVMLQPVPQVPVQVAPEPHEKLQPAVDALQVSNPHDWSLAQMQLFPVHTVPQPAIATPITDNANTSTKRIFITWTPR